MDDRGNRKPWEEWEEGQTDVGEASHSNGGEGEIAKEGTIAPEVTVVTSGGISQWESALRKRKRRDGPGERKALEFPPENGHQLHRM